MLMVFNKHLVFVILISITSGMPSVKRQTKPDKICGETRSILSVKSALMVIATAATNIEELANDIEQHILNKSPIVDRLKGLVALEMDSIPVDLPGSKYHDIFPILDNVDKEFLVHLLKEAYYASSYYYNSIADISEKNGAPQYPTDSEFKEIPYYLSNEIICKYRSILDVYSYDWSSINQTNRIEFSERKYQIARSLIHDVHSIIIIRLLREWMQRIHSVIINLEEKFY